PADVTELGKFYDTLSPAVKQSFFGKKIGDIVKASKSTEIGNMAPDFTLNNPDGKPVSLSSLRGQYVLVDFWASWCGPCRQENPNVVKAYQAYKSKGFTILGVSLDKDRDPWLEAIKKDKLTWEQVSDLKFWQSPVVELYGIRGIPANVLLDKEGKIIAKNLRGADLEAKLAEVLN
ncbi:MAG TPA: TlpA disulfide reductase family protein, partial [Phnomibacter sp.]|nr:TlpA disulfide reductase family protein [Phnomibacter sp.]